MTNPDSEINEEAEAKAIEKWLRMVDKPLATKKGDKKDRVCLSSGNGTTKNNYLSS